MDLFGSIVAIDHLAVPKGSQFVRFVSPFFDLSGIGFEFHQFPIGKTCLESSQTGIQRNCAFTLALGWKTALHVAGQFLSLTTFLPTFWTGCRWHRIGSDRKQNMEIMLIKHQTNIRRLYCIYL